MRSILAVAGALMLSGCALYKNLDAEMTCKTILTKDAGYLKVCEQDGFVKISSPDGSPLPDWLAGEIYNDS